MTTIKTNKKEILNITKGKSLRWYSTNAYGGTKKVVWHDENGGMWVKMSGEFREVRYRTYGFDGDMVDKNAVRPTYRRYACEI